MAFNGSGTFLINTAGQPVVAGTVISSTAFNALTADLATGLSTAITKDGQTTVTANIPMATFKFTGLGVGSAAGDSANLSQVQSTVTKLLASVSGADTVTATASPTLAAYAAGQMFYFVAAGDNTTSVTLNIDALGAKDVTRDGSVALAAADIKSGEVVVVVYDGTRFQVVSQLNSAGDATFANVSITSALNVGGVATFSGNVGIGTSSPWSQVSIGTPAGGSTGYFGVKDTVHGGDIRFGKESGVNNNAMAGTFTNNDFEFYTNSTQRARITSSGDFLVGTTTNPAGTRTLGFSANAGGNGIDIYQVPNTTDWAINATSGNVINFYSDNGAAIVYSGAISVNGIVTTYGSISDYRLKTVIGAVNNAGQRIDALQPVEYTWNDNGERARGFLAHQFQEVYANSVSGTKDAVDAEGKPVHQSMQASTSEVIADLVAELQSLRKRVAELESK